MNKYSNQTLYTLSCTDISIQKAFFILNQNNPFDLTDRRENF